MRHRIFDATNRVARIQPRATNLTGRIPLTRHGCHDVRHVLELVEIESVELSSTSRRVHAVRADVETPLDVGGVVFVILSILLIPREWYPGPDAAQ
jgi:hypothetical protein